MVGLADLPAPRREALLWHYALELDYDGVDDLVTARAAEPCRWDWKGDLRELVAVLGDDGRYHLRVGTRVLCGQEKRRRPGELAHDQWCHWWTDRTRYRIQAPPGLDRVERGFRSRTVRWIVRLTDTVTAAELVPFTRRCPAGLSRTVWPSTLDPSTARGRLRIRLITEFGSLCQACRQAPAFAIDHDHFTGRVRGLLCRNCNARVDRCPHVSGCPWADYLNNPPAAPLRLTVPNRRISSGQQARIDYLGFNPLA